MSETTTGGTLLTAKPYTRELNASVMLIADLSVTLVVLQSIVAASLGFHLPWIWVIVPLVATNVAAAWYAGRRGFTALPFGANTVFVMVVFGDLLATMEVRGESGLGLIGACLLLYAAVVLFVTLLVLRVRPTLPRKAFMLPLAAICICFLVLSPLVQLAKQPPPVWLGAALLWFLLTRRAPALLTWLAPLVVWGLLSWLTFGGHNPSEPVTSLSLTSTLHFDMGAWFLAGDFWRRAVPLIALLATANAFANLENVASAQHAGDDQDAHVATWIACGGTALASLCGAGAPITVYIGHPVYKKLGGGFRYVLIATLLLVVAVVPFGSWIMRWAPVFVFYGAVIYIGTGVAALVRPQISSVRSGVAAAVPMLPFFAFWAQTTFDLTSPVLSVLAEGSALLSVGWAMLLWSDGGRVERLVICALLAAGSLGGVVHATALSLPALVCATAYAGIGLFMWRSDRI